MAYNANHRYFLEVMFNGAHYSGWQVQPHSPTIQGTMQEKLSTILQEEVKLIGCGRTDARVHAKQFFAHFDPVQPLDANFVEWANRILPRNIWVKALYEPQERIHARFDAKSRTYEYLICTNRNPFYIDLATYFYRDLDVGLLNDACRILYKYQDFEAFSKVNKDLKHYQCDVYNAQWEQVDDHLFKLTITANRFVRSMVRLLAATMIKVGNGKMSVEEFEEILASRDRNRTPDAAPPDGLYLSEVQYDEGMLQPVGPQTMDDTA